MTGEHVSITLPICSWPNYLPIIGIDPGTSIHSLGPLCSTVKLHQHCEYLSTTRMALCPKWKIINHYWFLLSLDCRIPMIDAVPTAMVASSCHHYERCCTHNQLLPHDLETYDTWPQPMPYPTAPPPSSISSHVMVQKTTEGLANSFAWSFHVLYKWNPWSTGFGRQLTHHCSTLDAIQLNSMIQLFDSQWRPMQGL